MIDRGRGPLVVLVPGIQGRWEWMAPAVDALAARCRVVTFSLCDEWGSGFRWRADRGFANYLDQIDEALGRAGAREAVIVGVSYGGAIAAEYAARRPQAVTGLALVSAITPDWTPDARARACADAPWLMSPVFVAGAVRRMSAELAATFPSLTARAAFAAAQSWRVVRAFMWPPRMARRVRWFETHEFADVRVVGAPVLVVTGEDGLDQVVPTEVTKRYLQWLPQARHAVIERTGHVGCVTRPDRFAAVVAAFAREVEESGREPAQAAG
ncbi:MAG: alpha/beta hydrolase [Acidobacteriota bacterium]